MREALDRMQRARRRLGWSYLNLAKKIRTSKSSCARWLNGEPPMTLDMVKEVAAVLTQGLEVEMRKYRGDEEVSQALLRMQESLGELTALWIRSQEPPLDDQQPVTRPEKISSVRGLIL